MAGESHAPRLIGREPALAALRAAVSAVSSAELGRGQFLLIAGEPGIGKTALLAEAAAEAAASGARVLWGQSWDTDGAPPYWPWVQILRVAIAAGADPGDAVQLLPEPASTGLPADRPEPGADAAQARFRLFDGVVRCLAGLAAHRPVLVVLDDLHWADEGSLRLLEFAARHLAASRVLLLGAYRDEEATERLRRLAGTAARVTPPGLSCAEVAGLMREVAASVPPESVAVDVWRRTGGNPFLVRELTSATELSLHAYRRVSCLLDARALVHRLPRPFLARQTDDGTRARKVTA